MIVTTEQAKVVSVVPPMATVTSLQSPEPVVATTAATSAAATEFVSNESGPRVAGARRSTERIRKKSTQPTNDDKNDTTDSSEQ